MGNDVRQAALLGRLTIYIRKGCFMEFHIMTLFPEMMTGILNESITGRAQKAGLITVRAWNIRDYAQNTSRHVDDYIYGGGPGMLMQCEPIDLCFQAILQDLKERGIEDTPRVIYLSPKGETFRQTKAEAFAAEPDRPLILLCGHYEGIDERVLTLLSAEEISLGDFVLTGGELGAAIIVDAVSRLLPGVLGDDTSAIFESFHEDLLECPQYTRPEIYKDLRVPEILLSGNHARIEAWRLEQAEKLTEERRPDLYRKYREAHPPLPEKKRRKKRTDTPSGND